MSPQLDPPAIKQSVTEAGLVPNEKRLKLLKKLVSAQIHKTNVHVSLYCSDAEPGWDAAGQDPAGGDGSEL